jgi:hypothetical protein
MASSELGKKMIATNPRKTAKKAYSTSSSPCSSAKNSVTVFLIAVVQFCNRSLQGVNETHSNRCLSICSWTAKAGSQPVLALAQVFQGQGHLAIWRE